MNKGGNHWTLFIINFQDQSIHYLDSMHGHVQEEVLEGILRFIDSYLPQKKAIDWKKWEFVECKDIPRQRAFTNNCGVHILTWAYIIATGSCTSFTDENLDLVRVGISNILCKIRETTRKAASRNKNFDINMFEFRENLPMEEHVLKIKKIYSSNEMYTLNYLGGLKQRVI